MGKNIAGRGGARVGMANTAKVARAAKRFGNTLVSGAGAGSTVDRGAVQTPSNFSLSPYYQPNYLFRYQQYTNLYETSWEARKIIDIPIDDAMRHETMRKGLSADDELIISRAWEDYNVKHQLTRALKQERLLGGSVLLGVMLLQDGEKLDQPLTDANIMEDDLLALNVIDVTKLSRTSTVFDPFSADYDKVTGLLISGVEVDRSRMIVFDGDSLFGRNAQRVLQTYRYNPLGFGESKLAVLYDVLMRALGTQQGAYQLVNMSSAIMILVNNLRSLNAVDSDSETYLRKVAQQMSIYNAAVFDGKDVKVEQHSASFGSVPELVMTFTQFLAAASDIPVTRFMGSSADGMNATGEGDSRNYYDMVDTLRNDKRKRAESRILDWMGASLFGYNEWKRRSAGLVLEYPPLWNLDAVQQATRDEIVVRTILSMYQVGLITPEAAVQELVNRELFDSDVRLEDIIAEQELPESDLNLGDPDALDSFGQGA